MNNGLKQKQIGILITLLCIFIFVFPIISDSLKLSDITPKSSTNTFFNGKLYPFEITDVYDDADLTKVYTDAYLQTEWYNYTAMVWNGTINEDQVSDVNNTCYKSPKNTQVSMVEGSYDNTDNMRADDGSYSTFTSTESDKILYVDGWNPTYGTGSGNIENTRTDDTNYYTIDAQYTGSSYCINGEFSFTPFSPSGGDFYVSYHITSTSPDVYIRINGGNWKIGNPNLDADDQFRAGINTVSLYGSSASDFQYYVYFFIMEDVADPALGTINATMELDFSDIENEDLLGLNVSSFHYTNTSLSIIGKMYDYTASSWVQMFSSSHTSEYQNDFVDTSSVDDYFDNDGHVLIQLFGEIPNYEFKLFVDYIKVQFYYKMDLIIYKTFYTNGMWRYRWKLVGSLQYTEWVYFEVIDPIPNFHAISESDKTTWWKLQGADISPVEDFHDAISSDVWNLYDVSETVMQIHVIPTEDAMTDVDLPDYKYGSETYIHVYYTGSSINSVCYFNDPDNYDYLKENFTDDSQLKVYQYAIGTSCTIKTYSTSSFDESTITWNNQPAKISLLDSTSVSSSIGWKYIGLGSDRSVLWYRLELDANGNQIYNTKESSYDPNLIHYISKTYFGGGYVYMQTNKTESLSLKSIDYGTHYTLESGDYFEVDFQTSSDSQIYLILYKNGVVNKTLTLSASGNSNFNRHIAKISVDELVEFDQLKISSTFEDKDYAKIYDIKTFKYTLTGDYKDFYIASHNQRDIYMTPDTYNLRIFEEGDEKVNTEITIPEDDYFIYTPTETQECRLVLFNLGKEVKLDFDEYHVSINRSLNGQYGIVNLLDNIFSADVGTNVKINVSDKFYTLVKETEEPVSDYIDLELEVYSLQIKNLQDKKTIIDINSTMGSYEVLSGESVYFMLSEAWYQIGYYDTNLDYNQFLIYLDSNQAYEINASKLCFLSYTDQQGNHLYFEDFKTYINGTMIYENVFYAEIGNVVSINITDRYDVQLNYTLYTVLAGNNYIAITLDMYELKLKNQQNEFNNINITRSPYPINGDTGEVVESGHFPATYSFTDEEDGTSGIDIEGIYSDSTISTTIVGEYRGHKKVIHYYKEGGSSVNFDSFTQVSGTVEVWLNNPIDDDYYFRIFSTGGAGIAEIYMRFASKTNFRSYYGNGAGGSDYVDTSVEEDAWVHVKIKFDCVTDKQSIWVNGVLKIDNLNFGVDKKCDTMGKLNLYSGDDCEGYIDAIGYSWDTNYNIGDNLHDYYYLAHDSFESYNKTEAGWYTASDSLDYYTEYGVFYGTYDFRDEVGETGTDIDWVDSTSYDCEVIEELNYHKAVLNISSDSGSGTVINDFTLQTSGTIEFWICVSTISSNYWEVYLKNTTYQTAVWGLFTDGNQVRFMNKSTWMVIATYSYDTWHHLKIIFDCSSDTFDVYINGTLEADDFEFRYPTDSIRRLQFGGYNIAEGEYIGIDAIGYSWDDSSHSGVGYKVGYNVNPYDLEPLLQNNWDSNYFDYGEAVAAGCGYKGHRNVIILFVPSGSYLYFSYNFPDTYSDGTIEFWKYGITGEIQITGDLTIYLYITGGYYRYLNSTGASIWTGVKASNTWNHNRVDFDISAGTFDWYINGTKIVDDGDMYDHTGTYIGKAKLHAANGNQVYFDALGYSWDSEYDIGDNENSHGKQVLAELENAGWGYSITPDISIGISGEYNLHKKFVNLTDNDVVSGITFYRSTTTQTFGTVEFYIKGTDVTDTIALYLQESSTRLVRFKISSNQIYYYYSGAYHDATNGGVSDNTWYHIRIDFECGSGGYMGLLADTYDFYLNGVLLDGDIAFENKGTNVNSLFFASAGTQFGYTYYIDALAYSWISGYYIGDNYNYYDCDSSYSWTPNIAPDEIVSFRLLKGFYNIWITDSEETKSFSFRLFDDTYFIINSTQMCFLSYTNQKGEYLEFNRFKTYINDTLLYENIFYERIGRDVNITITDHYDYQVYSSIYTILKGDNYIPIILTMYSLKIMSQQLCFNHINITRDPNYYYSPYSWSEWIAPSEIIEFELFPGYYKINLTNNEAGSYSYYAYTFSGDDILLITSDNTIYNVLVNLANVNATLGNQITNVHIDLTNQNTAINNSIINIDIDIGNINSSLGNMLLNIDVDVNNVLNNISALYVFTNNSFINLGNNMNSSFIYIENNIISINQSISNLIVGVSNDIYLINGTISTMITQIENNIALMNVSIMTALFDLDTTLSQIGSNITNNFILLNNSIYLNNLNINDSRIAIINNLALVNNTISNLIAQVYSSVYMINNSIYTAILDLGTYLSLMNNTIAGNLTIVLEQNEFLTELYRMTMFSELLNWTNIGLNTSLLTDQIDVWTFINHYVNQSIEVHLKYQNLIQNLTITAKNFRDQWLPRYNVSYNLWSVAQQKYLDKWKDLDPKNKTVDFGFHQVEVPDIPVPDFTGAALVWLLLGGIIGGVAIVMIIIYYKLKLQDKKIKQKNMMGHPPSVLKDKNPFY